jgi:hypothetical protein
MHRIREGKEKTYSLNEVIKVLGLDASDERLPAGL